MARPHAASELWADLTTAGVIVDVLVNNAGVGLYGALDMQDSNQLERMVELDVVALTMLTRLALPGHARAALGTRAQRRLGRRLSAGGSVAHERALAAYRRSQLAERHARAAHVIDGDVTFADDGDAIEESTPTGERSEDPSAGGVRRQHLKASVTRPSAIPCRMSRRNSIRPSRYVRYGRHVDNPMKRLSDVAAGSRGRGAPTRVKKRIESAVRRRRR